MAATSPQSSSRLPFLRNLASSDRKLRTESLASLRRHLSARRHLGPSRAAAAMSPSDLRKLWEGIFASMWMCDRALAQQRLADEVAELLFVLAGTEPRGDGHVDADENEGAAVALWLAAFWETMAAHWASIDALRMDKFMLLVRRVLGASMRWVAQGGAPSSSAGRNRADALVAVLRGGPLESEGDIRLVPVGLRLHFLDIWIDEAEKASLLGGGGGDGVAKGRSRFVDEVVVTLEKVKRCPIKPVRTRAAESLDDERLQSPTTVHHSGAPEVMAQADSKDGGEPPEASDGDSWDGFDD